MASILIVDDSITARRNLRIILEEAGHTIIGEASNGMQAALIYQRHKPDIVTMDISMPDVDGVTAVKEIMSSSPEAKVIMVSALQQKNKVYEAIKSGAKSYVLKPYTEEKILGVINDVLKL